MSSDAFAERILEFVRAKGYRPKQASELAEAMGIGEDEQGDFHAACKALMKTGRMVLGSRNALVLPEPRGTIVGTYRGNVRGFGFIIPDTPNSHGDLYIPVGKAGDAMTGDTVSARVVKRGKRGGKMLYEGLVVSVVKRGQSRFVGELLRQFRRWFVVPDGNILHVPIVVGDPGARNARAGDQVVVEIVQYPEGGREARGVVIKVLGRRGEPAVDTLSIIEQYQLPGDFPEAVLKEARKAARSFDPAREAASREDLRKLTIITIDPTDARDFDDAISLTKNRDGTVELGVHIADVAHFVRVGGALDDEAQDRSTSVYLPRTVIPMLPEVLSNEVCSLQERVPRLTKSVFITYTKRGLVKKSRLANTMIKSTKRVTYQQASAALDGKRGRLGAKVVTLLEDMEQLAKVIRRRRLREGMLELDLPAVEPVFGGDGTVIDVQPADTSFSHKIIEMFMVEANEAVSRLLTERKVPHLRRVHGEPRDLASGDLRKFLKVLGHDLPTGADRFALQALLDSVRGKPDAFAVHLAVLRSMNRAEYAPTLIGHFALASEHYAHFTSPIRRYPDLTMHRLIDAYVSGVFDKRGGVKQVPSDEELTRLGALCSTNERRAEAAERELMLVLVLRLLEKHLGEHFQGIVTGVANVGVFVQLERYLVDGLVKFDNLPDDWWELDPSRGCVVGQRSGTQITVGDRLEVVLARVHIPTRKLELALAKPIAGKKGSKKQRASREGDTTAKPTGRQRTPTTRPTGRKRKGGGSRRATKRHRARR